MLEDEIPIVQNRPGRLLLIDQSNALVGEEVDQCLLGGIEKSWTATQSINQLINQVSQHEWPKFGTKLRFRPVKNTCLGRELEKLCFLHKELDGNERRSLQYASRGAVETVEGRKHVLAAREEVGARLGIEELAAFAWMAEQRIGMLVDVGQGQVKVRAVDANVNFVVH